DERLVALDLEPDAVKLRTDQVVVSLDIDSLIFVTTHVKAKDKNPGIFLSPTADHAAPISKNNHVYVNLLLPPSPLDPDGPTRELRFPLSAVPQVRLTQLSEGNSGARVLACFPHAIHKNTHGFYDARVPWGSQVLFWERVILPCVARHCDVASTPYFATTVKGNTLRTATKGQPGGNLNRPKQLRVSPDMFSEIQRSMWDVVHSDPELAAFRGFFFVVDLKGCKQSSTINLTLDDTDLPESEGPLAKLAKQFNELDLDYMRDRRNGELYLDLAFSTHPDLKLPGGEGHVPLVGLWRQEWLEASYGAADFTMGKAHSANTLSRYGAMQAEMGLERSRRVHIVFRNTYLLQYEARRTADNVPVSATDKAAFEMTEAYHKDCARRKEAYTEASKLPFGARDEWRVGPEMYSAAIKDCNHLARACFESNGILFIPLELWFGFLMRRAAALEFAQSRTYKINPVNYGALSGLYAHLKRSIDNTVPVPPPHVRQTLSILCLPEIAARFGMAWLHNLNLDLTSPLDELAFEDKLLGVYKSLGYQVGKNPNRKKAVPKRVAGTSKEYPIGEWPTLASLRREMGQRPLSLIKPWVPVSPCDNSMPAAEVFVLFTAQVWDMIQPELLLQPVPPPPATLEEAMERWSAAYLFQRITEVDFIPLISGLQTEEAARGRPQLSFLNRRPIFFPMPEENIRPGSRWLQFRDRHGYLRRLAEFLKQMAKEDGEILLESLADMLDNMQCLPCSVKGTASSSGK
ncbi:hypothetical protein BOTBODRAFT_179860, partial [Botryobasidium botryosum FD-172 SS1]